MDKKIQKLVKEECAGYKSSMIIAKRNKAGNPIFIERKETINFLDCPVETEKIMDLCIDGAKCRFFDEKVVKQSKKDKITPCKYFQPTIDFVEKGGKLHG